MTTVIPQHCLTLKFGKLIMLSKNLNPSKLCNDYSIQFKALRKYVIEVIIIFSGCEESTLFAFPAYPSFNGLPLSV